MQQQLRSVVQELFPQFDRNSSGALDCKQLGSFFNEVFRRLGYKITVTDAQAEESVKYIDKNSDNQVNQQEVFVALRDIISKRKPSNPQPNPPPIQPPPNPPNQGGWQQPPANNWGQPQPQNIWGPPQPQPQNPWGVPQPQPQNNWGQPQQNYTYGLVGGWGNTQFEGEIDMQLKRQIDHIYLRYDRNGSGSLEGREMVGAFNEVLRSMGSQHTVTQSQADHLLQAIDSSSDGSIQKPEFFKMLKYLLDAPNDY